MTLMIETTKCNSDEKKWKKIYK